MKVLKNRIFQLIITAIIFTTVGVVASNINASQVDYKTTNVETALNSLYDIANSEVEFGTVNINGSYGDQLASRTASLTLDKGNYLVTIMKNRSWILNSALTSLTRNTTNKLTFDCSKECSKTYVSSYEFLSTPSTGTNDGYPRLSTFYTLYYLEVTEDGTVISTTWDLNASNKAIEDVELIVTTINK